MSKYTVFKLGQFLTPVLICLLLLIVGCPAGVPLPEYEKVKADLDKANAELAKIRADLDALRTRFAKTSAYIEIFDIFLDPYRAEVGLPTKYGYAKGAEIGWVTTIDSKVKATRDAELARLWKFFTEAPDKLEGERRASMLMFYLIDYMKVLTAK